MKNTFLIGMVISGLAFVATSSQAQISDNDSSASVLAAYCAQSSGLPASNYESYCRELAKTIGQLPVAAQHRVFEDKMPVVTGSGGFGGLGETADQTQTNSSAGTTVGQETGSADSGSTESGQGNTDSTQSDTGSTQGNSSQSDVGNTETGSDSSGDSKKTRDWGGLLDIVDAINEFLFGRR